MNLLHPEHLAIATILTAVLLLAGCAANPVTGEQDFVLMSEQQELELGREYHQSVLETYRVYEDADLQAYVELIGERMAAVSHRDSLSFRFTLLDSTEINAFALPGGYIYITRGLLAYLNSEAELAAVLGHEIGHVTARHSVRQHSAKTTTTFVTTIIAAGTGIQGADQLSDVVGTALVRGYGREHELEADRLGAEYLARAGYDPQAMMDVIRVLKNQELFDQQLAKAEGREPHAYHGLFSTHPDNDHRLQEVVAAAGGLQGDITRGRNRDGFLDKLDRLTFGPGAHDGIVRDNHFYHAELGIALRFPANWTIENGDTSLTGRPPGKSKVGMIVQLEERDRKTSPAEFMRKRLELDIRDGRPLEAGGLVGYTGIAERLQADQAGAFRAARVSVIYLDDHAWIFAGLAPDRRTLDRHDSLFLDTARSLHRLLPAEKLLAEPLRLSIMTAGPRDSFAGLARTSRIPDHAETRLRLLNDRYPKGGLTPGSRIKIVR